MTEPVMEFKNVAAVPVLDAAAAEWQPSPLDNGQSDAIVAVTGIEDEVKDVITPGAFAKTLAKRTPKVCWGHDWNRPIGRTLSIKELMPGDPNLPKTTADGQPWPKEAGALIARPLLNLDEPDGLRAYRALKFFAGDDEKGYTNEATWSIGYKAAKARHVGGKRHLDELDLYEYSPVLHPANLLATLQGIKSGEPEDLETKVRKVKDQAYWGYPVGTPITAHMRPRGVAARRLRTRGIVPSRNVGTTTSADAAGNPASSRPTDKARVAAAHAEGLFPEPDSPVRLKARKPKGQDEQHVSDLTEALAKNDGEGAQGAYQGLLDEGITPDELAQDLGRAETPNGVDEGDWNNRVEDAVAEYRAAYRRETNRQQSGADTGGDETAPEGQDQGGGGEPDGKTTALSRIQDTIKRLDSQQSDQTNADSGLAAATTSNMLKQFTADGADVHASPDGRLAAVDNGKTWVIVDTAHGQSLPADGNATPEQIDSQLDQLSKLDIPWGDPEAMRSRWSDPNQRQADQKQVAAILGRKDAVSRRGKTTKTPKPASEQTTDGQGRSGGTSPEPRKELSTPLATQIRDALAATPDSEPLGNRLVDAAPEGEGGKEVRGIASNLNDDVKRERRGGKPKARIAPERSAQRSFRSFKLTPEQATERADALDAMAEALDDLSLSNSGRDRGDGHGNIADYARAEAQEYRKLAGQDDGGEPEKTGGNAPTSDDASVPNSTGAQPEPPALKPRTVPLKQKDLSKLTDEELAAHGDRARSTAFTTFNGSPKNKEAMDAQGRVRDEQARRADAARRTVPAHPLSEQDYRAASDRAMNNRFRAQDIASRKQDVANQNAAADQAEQVAASAPEKIEKAPEGSVLVAGGRVALKNPGKASWALATADGKTFAGSHLLDSGSGRSVKLNKAQADSLAQTIADITDAQGNKIPLTAPDSKTWVPGFRDAQGQGTQGAIMAAVKDWADKNGFTMSPTYARLADAPSRPARLPEPGVADESGFLPGERAEDIHPGDQVRLPDGSVHTVSGQHLEKNGREASSRNRDYGVTSVLDFTDGTTYNMGSSGRVDVKPAEDRDPNDTRDPGMGFNSASDMGQPLNKWSPQDQRSIDAANPNPVPAGTRIIYTPDRGEYGDNRPRVGQVTDRWTNAQGNWFQVVEYDDGTFDAINARKLADDGKLTIGPSPQEEDDARKQWSAPSSDGSRDRGSVSASGGRVPQGGAPEARAGDEQPPAPAPSGEEIAREQIEDAEATVDAAMGLTEDPDGNLEVDQDVADRQDRVENLINQADSLDLASQDNATLQGQRRDLVDELRLQNAIAQRDRTQGGGQQNTTDGGSDQTGGTGGEETGNTGADTGSAPEDTGPKRRPGVAGAAEDLADALEGDDPQARADAIARMESSLRRSRSESTIVAEMLAAAQRDGGLAAAIEAGDVTPDTLREFASNLRDERRQQRNTAARNRRAAKRLERDRIRSLIGQYDAELRRRNLNPEDYGGAPPSVDGEPSATPTGPEIPVGAEGKAFPLPR